MLGPGSLRAHVPNFRTALPLEGSLAEVHCRLRLVALLAKNLNIVVKVFATASERNHVVNVHLRRQVPTHAHAALSTDSLTHSLTETSRSIVATGYRRTPLRV